MFHWLSLPLILHMLAWVTNTVSSGSNVPPRFVNFKQVIFVPENTTINTTIGNLTGSDIDDERLNFGISGNIAKRILKLVRVGPLNMDIVLVAELDRETVENYFVVFEVSDNNGNKIQRSSTIYVRDVNDNHPTFLNLPYRADILEDTAPDTEVFQVSASDPDKGIWGMVIYDITTEQELFSIDKVTGVVTLMDSLDYETEQFYQLGILAYDGDGLNSTTELIIRVMDVQDTAPFFLNLPYVASVAENASVGTSILQLSALDGDQGVPNPVNYTFHSGNHEYFELNAISGVISVARKMNREDPDILNLFGVLDMSVQAEEVTDTPQGPTTATAPVTIRITDVNDQVPSFSQSTYKAEVLENTQTRIPVTLLPIGVEITVTDLDEGDNGRFKLSLEENGQEFDVFDVVPSTILNEATVLIRVKNSSALDYERIKSFNFEIVAKEYLTQEKHERRSQVTVQLVDVNDNWPEFDQDVYFAQIDENSPKDTIVTKITGTDKDSGSYGTLTYKIRGASAKLFRVDPNSGEVFVNVDADLDTTLLDREKSDRLYLTFEAVDGGGLRTSVQLEIQLDDVNDNAPIIARSLYEGYIRENSGTLDKPLVIQAEDFDLAPNNNISYHIVEGDPDEHFTINKYTGEISLVSALDYEMLVPSSDGILTLVVEARDAGTPSLATNTTVVFLVQDENDNTPKFVLDNYSAVIPEIGSEGNQVTQVNATDSDGTPPNNYVVYRIESGAKDKFRIHPRLGIISVDIGANLDRDDYGSMYNLSILAIDRGTPPLTATTLVVIEITDVNNKPPRFQPGSVTTTIREDTPVSMVIYDCSAEDADEDASLYYSFIDDRVYGEDEDKREYTDKDVLQKLFGIHSNGSVYVNSILDRELVEEIRLTIFVRDLNAKQPAFQNATATLTIILEDVNDNPPEFVPTAFYRSYISEASTPGKEIKQVLAIDRDKHLAPVQYYLVNDSPQSHAFSILDKDRYAGVITLQKTIDHEETAIINLTIMAVDSGEPPLNSTAIIMVEVEDVNDNSPDWVTFNETVYVLENATQGSEVTVLHAADRDSGEFGRVMYYVTAGSPGAMDTFDLDPNKGILTTTVELDHEVTSSFTLTVEARDNNLAPARQQRKTSGYMTIFIHDVNDNVPEFNRPTYTAVIVENAKVKSTVITVKATDTDSGSNGVIVYSVDKTSGNASHLFDVKSDTGEVFIRKSLQGHLGSYTLVVIATDKGKKPLSNFTVVHFSIEDVNDHKPHIIKPKANTTFYIIENADVGYFLTRVVAQDNDDGLNGQVQYEFVHNPPNIDWKKFYIDPVTGNITTTSVIDREQQEIYYLEVKAYDMGTPTYEDRRTLRIMALDVDDNPPVFDRQRTPPPYRTSVVEETSDISVADLALAEDPDIGNNSLICYYLVGGDKPYKDHFTLHKTTGRLHLHSSIDREMAPVVSLIIKASQDCTSGRWEQNYNTDIKWDVTDTSLLWIEVLVEDINDNPPRFKKKHFTAGVTRDSQYGEFITDLSEYCTDVDDGDNQVISYYIQHPFQITEPLKTQLKGDIPFIIGMQNGIVRTNVYFQQNMHGHIEFTVYANDSLSMHNATATVSVYLLNQAQQVKIIVRGEPDEVGSFKDHFAEFLTNITGATINVDKIVTHEDENGKPDIRRTDMYIHGIDTDSGEVLDARVLISLFDKNYRSLEDLYKTYNVIKVVPALEVVKVASFIEREIFLAILVIAGVLLCMLIIISIIFCVCRRRYRRKLKAANAMVFGSRESGLNRLEMPGTNMHTYEGSNPIWLEQAATDQNRDSDGDSKNSLDENAVIPYTDSQTDFTRRNHSNGLKNGSTEPVTMDTDSNLYLKTILRDRDTAKNKRPNGVNQEPETIADNGSKTNNLGNHTGGYDNDAFQSEVIGGRRYEIQATKI